MSGSLRNQVGASSLAARPMEDFGIKAENKPSDDPEDRPYRNSKSGAHSWVGAIVPDRPMEPFGAEASGRQSDAQRSCTSLPNVRINP